MNRSRPSIAPPLERIVDWGLGTRWQDLPVAVKEVNRHISVVFVGFALGGLDSRKSLAAAQWAQAFPRRPGTSVPGVVDRLAGEAAAFAWGELINALEFDPDLTPCHVAPFVLPATWAHAEAHGRTGEDWLAAVAVAHEVAAQIAGRMPGLRVVGGTVAHPTYGFRERWSAYTAGILGALIGAARLSGDGESTVLSALGIASGLAPVPISSRFFFTARPSDLKYGSPGWVSMAALTALGLARAGYRGDANAVSGPNGLLTILGNGPTDLAGAAADLGHRWRILDTVFKRFPTGGVGHVGLDLFEQFLAETGTAPDSIESIEVRSDPIVGVPVLANREVTDPLDAQFSLAWSFALLPYYAPGPGWQSPAAFRDERVARLFAKVRVRADRTVVRDLHRQLVIERLPYVRRRPTRVVVRAGGRRWERSDSVARGYPERPMAPEELRTKFLRNSAGHLRPEEGGRLFTRLLALDEARSLATVAAVLRRASVKLRMGAS